MLELKGEKFPGENKNREAGEREKNKLCLLFPAEKIL